MSLVRKLDTNLWEIRINLRQRIARILFTVAGDVLVIHHGFIKKSQKTPSGDIKLAKDRIKKFES